MLSTLEFNEVECKMKGTLNHRGLTRWVGVGAILDIFSKTKFGDFL
jgi:hypothetical protein